jgi:hypothetical protein
MRVVDSKKKDTGPATADAPKDVKVRHVGDYLKADPAYRRGHRYNPRHPLSEVQK